MGELNQEHWSRIEWEKVVLKEEKEFAISGKQQSSVREETNAVSSTTVMIVQPTPKTAPPSKPPAPRGRSASRKRSLSGRSPSGKTHRQPFTRAVLRQANIQENKCPSLNKIQVKLPHQHSLFAMKLETEKATFYSLSDGWGLLAASTIKPEEREFVVDSGASRHIVSRKDLHSAELDGNRQGL